jgi:hypothetical protein
MNSGVLTALCALILGRPKKYLIDRKEFLAWSQIEGCGHARKAADDLTELTQKKIRLIILVHNAALRKVNFGHMTGIVLFCRVSGPVKDRAVFLARMRSFAK